MHKDTVLPAHSGLRPPMLVLILKKSSLCSLLIIKVIVILVSVRDLSIISISVCCKPLRTPARILRDKRMRSPQVIELITCLICSCITATSPSILFNIRKSVEALGQGQTLEIPPGTYNSSNCDIDVTVNNVTIRGAPGHVIIDCLRQRRHFTIWGEHVTVDGLNLVRGSAPFGECTGKNLQCPEEPNGGCILVLGNHASIRNSIFSECTASLCGGAIAVLNDN